MSSNGNKLELPASIVIRDLALKIEKSPIDLIKKINDKWCNGDH